MLLVLRTTCPDSYKTTYPRAAKGPSVALVTLSKRHLGWCVASQPGRASRPRPPPLRSRGRTGPSGAGLICSSASASAWAGQSELSAPGNNSCTAIPSIAASAQSIAFCVSSQCTAAHVYTHKKHKLV